MCNPRVECVQTAASGAVGRRRTLRLTIAAIRNTTKLGGAAPPAEGGRWKFSLLERRWVRRSQPLAAPKTLLTTHACDAVLRDYC